jgi:GNAT superfamily N-acetyltransferase
LEIPRREFELNEVRWWSRWARLERHGGGFLLSSEVFSEPFFNRAGAFACGDLPGTATWAERKLLRRGLNSTVLAFGDCKEADSLLASGYTEVDTMTVLRPRKPMRSRRVPGSDIVISRSAPGWTSAYLRAFYGSESLASRVLPIVSRLARSKDTTLLESVTHGRTDGVLAIFRTKGLAGVYCVGTIPVARGKGVATGLLERAQEFASAEGRQLFLQTLASDNVLEFYTKRGFEPIYSKRVLEKAPRMNGSSAISKDLGVAIERKAPVGSRQFNEVFTGFDRVGAVKAIFGAKTKEVLNRLSVEIVEGRGYMRIDDEKGSVVVNAKYLREGSEIDLYLDVIHELVHIRQHGEGKELWDKRYEYIDRPTEIEAYGVAVKEARRLGLTEEQVARYLKVEWIAENDFLRFLRNVGVSPKLESQEG